MASVLTADTKDLATIAANVAGCTKCRLSQGRTLAVPGEGNPKAEVMFIGEGPGKNEDLQGRPFVGAAGKLLDEMLAGVGMKRADVFITNVVKCRPPGNRDPELDEATTCTAAWLVAQVTLVDPTIIVLLGRHSLERFIPGKRISECHGKPMRATAPDGVRRVFFPLYHPAAGLYQGSLKATLVSDFAKVPAVLKAVQQEREKQALLDEMSAPGNPQANAGA